MKLTLKNIENKILKEVDCGLTAESGDFKTLAENVIAMYQDGRRKIAIGDEWANLL